MNKRNVTILAFASASSVAPFHLALSALSIEPRIDSLADACIYLAATFSIFLPYSAFAGLVVGVPIFFISQRFGIVTLWMATLAGSTAGACAAFAVFGYASVPIRLPTYVLLGAFAGLVFWLVRSVATKEH